MPAASHARLYELPALTGGLDAAPWARLLAPLAGWPRHDGLSVAVERRLWRDRHRGPLRDALLLRIEDELGLGTPAGLGLELDELVRPLRESRALRRLGDREARRIEAAAGGGTVAELGVLAAQIGAAAPVLADGFAELVRGLERLEGPVTLGLLVRPEATTEAGEIRGVEFRLRMSAAGALPATLRARAETLCSMGCAPAGSWTTFAGPEALADARAALRALRPLADADEPAAPLAAALLLALPGPRRQSGQVAGRPVSGPIPAQGAPLGRVVRTNGRTAVYRLPWEARTRHTLVVASTGAGKTTWLKRLIADDAERGRAIVVVDGHGDLAHELGALLGGLPGTLSVDPREEATWPLDLLHPDPLVAGAAIQSATEEVWPVKFAGPVFHRYTSVGLRLLVEAGLPISLTALERFYVLPNFREALLARARGSRLAAESAPLIGAMGRESDDDSSLIAWLAAKFGPLTQGPGRHLFDRADPTTWEQRIHRGDACVIALPTGLLGDAGTRLIGRMLLTRIKQSLAAQGAVPLDQRRPCSIIVDEAHLLAGPALGALFAEARKFGGSVTVATQTPGQLGRYRELVLANTENVLAGRLPVDEGRHLLDRAGAATVSQLPTLPRRHAVLLDERHETEHAAPVISPLALPDLRPARAALARRAAALQPDPKPLRSPEEVPAPAEPEAPSLDEHGPFLDAWLERRQSTRSQVGA